MYATLLQNIYRQRKSCSRCSISLFILPQRINLASANLKCYMQLVSFTLVKRSMIPWWKYRYGAVIIGHNYRKLLRSPTLAIYIYIYVYVYIYINKKNYSFGKHGTMTMQMNVWRLFPVWHPRIAIWYTSICYCCLYIEICACNVRS